MYDNKAKVRTVVFAGQSGLGGRMGEQARSGHPLWDRGPFHEKSQLILTVALQEATQSLHVIDRKKIR